jgi:WD40 repeat protein
VERRQSRTPPPARPDPEQSQGTVPIGSVAFSPDGHTLAIGDYLGSIQLWDVTDPANPRLLGQPLTGSDAPVSSMTFSPDGHTLASGSRDIPQLGYQPPCVR